MAKDDGEFHQGATRPTQKPAAVSFPKAQQEIQFAHDRGLVAWNHTQLGYPAMQVIVPDERRALALKALIETQCGPVSDLTVRQSSSQAGRWVVQMQLGAAEDAGLLPHGISYVNGTKKLPHGAAPGDLKSAERSRTHAIYVAHARSQRVTQGGIAAIGAIQGARNIIESYKEGDAFGATLAGAELASSGGGMVTQGIEALGKAASPVFKGALTKANLGVVLADGTYQVLKEEGLTHKVERGTAVAATTLAGVTVAPLLAGGLTASGGVAATGALAGVAGVAAPVVVATGAAYGAAVIGDTAIETRRLYEAVDGSFAESADFRHLISVTMRFADKLKDAGVTRSTGGRIDYGNGDNIARIRTLISSEMSRKQKVMAANASIVPRWLRWGKSLERSNDARSDLAILEAASQELEKRWWREAVATSVQGTSHPETVRIEERPLKLEVADARLSGINGPASVPYQRRDAHPKSIHPER